MRLLITALLLVTALMSGCASVPMASVDQDTRAKAFSPPPDKASLYIYRNEVLGSAIPMTVMVNGKNLGQTASKTYFHLDLQPGSYTIDSMAENTSTLTLKLRPNRSYFVWQEVKMGLWMARSLLQEVDEATGREGVMESKLIKTLVNDSEVRPLGAPPPDSIANKLRELEQLRKEGIISDEEFETKKAEFLKQM